MVTVTQWLTNGNSSAVVDQSEQLLVQQTAHIFPNISTLYVQRKSINLVDQFTCDVIILGRGDVPIRKINAKCDNAHVGLLFAGHVCSK